MADAGWRTAAKRPLEPDALETMLGNARWKEESAIDFTFTSAQIEGNTYTRADTIMLLRCAA